MHTINATLPIHRKPRAVLSQPQRSDQQLWATKGEESKQPIVRGRPPEPFPIEIWDRIIKGCSTTKAWAALCRTSWFFLQISQACLYKKVTLLSNSRPDCLSLLRFGRSLVLRRDLGAFVHNLSLIVWAPNPQNNPRSLLKHLDKFPNLKILQMQGILIDSDLCHSLHSHPRLSAVSFSRCTFQASVTNLSSLRRPNSSIFDIHIHLLDYSHNPVHDEPWAALAPFSLRSLTIFCPEAAQVLSSFRLDGKNHMLQKLSLTVLPTSIADFLITSTQLRHLTLYCLVTTNHPIFFSLPGDALPLLQYYAGPVELCELLLRNRPVKTVKLIRSTKLLSTTDYINMFDFMHLSSVPIIELKVSTDPVGQWLWSVPSTLRHLTFTLKKESFMRCLPALSHLTCLRTIRSMDHEHKENLSREELLQVSKICPSLQEVNLGYERWAMVQQNVWELFR